MELTSHRSYFDAVMQAREEVLGRRIEHLEEQVKELHDARKADAEVFHAKWDSVRKEIKYVCQEVRSHCESQFQVVGHSVIDCMQR